MLLVFKGLRGPEECDLKKRGSICSQSHYPSEVLSSAQNLSCLFLARHHSTPLECYLLSLVLPHCSSSAIECFLALSLNDDEESHRFQSDKIYPPLAINHILAT